VAAFNIGKKCKLLYPGYFMLSLNGSLLNEQNKLNKQMQCFILDSEGLIKTFQIPFHLILSDKSNQRVRDTLLFKKLKALVKNANSENGWPSCQKRKFHTLISQNNFHILFCTKTNCGLSCILF
jgi:hypothetical protein